jgi:formyl-CoA transferase
LGYDDLAAVHPACIYVSVSGFGNTVKTPYAGWPAYAAIVEAMSGIYEMKRVGDQPPAVVPVGALGDISSALFATIGILAALRHRDRTGRGQQVDIAMLDSMVAMTDIVTNFWSMGLRDGNLSPLIMHGFKADDGWFIIQVGREEQFARLAEAVGHREWLEDPRLSTRQGWIDHLDDVLRPDIEGWAESRSKLAACRLLSDVGLAAGPCLSPEEVVHDEHLRARNMLVSIDRTDDVAEPIIVPGNPIKLGDVPEIPDARVPWVGEHTDAVLEAELGLDEAERQQLRAAGTIA